MPDLVFGFGEGRKPTSKFRDPNVEVVYDTANGVDNTPPYPREEYQRTVTGRLVHFPELKPEDFHWRDIATGLACAARHAGQLTTKVTVAQHCSEVHDRMLLMGYPRPACFAGLMHDVEEYISLDMPRPLKYRPGMEWYRKAQLELRRRAFARYDVACDESTKSLVRIYDEWWLGNENFQLKPSGGPKPLPADCYRINPWDYCTALSEWSFRFLDHRPEEEEEK